MADGHLRHLLSQLPSEAQVPAGWVLEQLDSAEQELTLEDVATKVGRAVSTVRGWCGSGQLEGAYRLNGREWRVPSAALRRFLEQQRTGAGEGHSAVRSRGPVDLSSWRHQRRKASGDAT